MQQQPSNRPMSRSEKETETEASRLVEFVEEALGLVALHSRADFESMESIADRIERSARNLSVALREIAQERRLAQDEGDRLAS